MIIFILFTAFFATLASVGIMRDYALSRGLVDQPNYRSSHIEPTPRGGGVAIVFVFCVTSVALFFLVPSNMSALMPVDMVVIGFTAGIVAVTGWIDDHRFLSPLARMSAHLLAAVCCIAHFGIPHVPLGPWVIDLGWAGWPLAAIAVVWCVNFFNFMDGIDGIAAVEVITVAVGASVVLVVSAASYGLLPYLWLLVVVVAGFLAWNWPPAKIFMGDAASGFLGVLLAQFVLISSVTGEMMGINVWCWLILLGVFFVDATITLILRVIAGENPLQAHRQHAYQKAARNIQLVEGTLLSPRVSRTNAHRGVLLVIAGTNLFWLTPFAVAAALWPRWGVLFATIALVPLAAMIFLIARHREEVA